MNRLILALLLGAGSLAAQTWEVASPNDQVRLVVQLKKGSGAPGSPRSQARLYFHADYGAAASRVTVLPDAPLGLSLEKLDLVDGLKFVSASAPQSVEVSYEMPHGKRRLCRNSGTGLTLAFRNARGRLELDLRAFNDGVAFRYRLPETDPHPVKLLTEQTGFAFGPGTRLWLQPNDQVTVYAPSYETYYSNGVPAGTVSSTGLGWAFPVLFQTGDGRHWGLVTESNLRDQDSASRLTSTATGGVYRIRFAEPAEGSGYGAVEPSSARPWEMPWRVIILGDSPASIVESTLVNDLSDPTLLKDLSWIKPGRAAWSWWSDQISPRDGEKQKRFVDFAAEMGWEYVLIDANWTIMDKGTVHDVIRHAKSKGVGILLWYNTGGPNNIVTEKPRDSLFYPEVRRFELAMLRDWGIKGIKVDFFQSDKPAMIKLYRDILKDAAEFGIMVNFHGCTLPRGWARTYPNLLSMEAIRGSECYLFDPVFPVNAPVQNTISPYTRNVVGSMDYTPMALGDAKYPHLTTFGHELALTVLFESGWVHFADDPDQYRQLPADALRFIRELPVAWDDTRWVAGMPGESAVLARRKGQDWFLAGVNGRTQPLSLKLDLRRVLGPGSHRMTLLTDGAGPRQLRSEQRPVSTAEPVLLTLPPYGGFAARLTPAQP